LISKPYPQSEPDTIATIANRATKLEAIGEIAEIRKHGALLQALSIELGVDPSRRATKR